MNSRLGAVDVKRTVRSFTDRDCNSGPRALTGSAWLGWSVLVWPLAIAGLIGAQSNPTWAAILFAVLGSSALGAIFGGYVTTRMRGRLEREEAWRTRLIEAADNLNGALSRVLRTLGNLLGGALSREPLRSEDGTLTEPTAAALESVWALLNEVGVSLSHLELLFSADSNVYSEGIETMRLIQRTAGLLDGRPPAQHLIKAVVAERATPGAGKSLLWKVGSAGYLDHLEILITEGSGPLSFDPADDVNVAQWAKELHLLAGRRAHAFSQAAHAYIEAYRST